MIQITNWEKEKGVNMEEDQAEQKGTEREKMSESKKIGSGKIN